MVVDGDASTAGRLEFQRAQTRAGRLAGFDAVISYKSRRRTPMCAAKILLELEFSGEAAEAVVQSITVHILYSNYTNCPRNLRTSKTCLRRLQNFKHHHIYRSQVESGDAQKRANCVLLRYPQGITQPCRRVKLQSSFRRQETSRVIESAQPAIASRAKTIQVRHQLKQRIQAHCRSLCVSSHTTDLSANRTP